MGASVGAKVAFFFGYPVRPSFGYARFCYIWGAGIRLCPANLVPCAGVVYVCVTHFRRFRVPGPFGFFLPVIFSGVQIGHERIPIAQRGFSMTLSGDMGTRWAKKK